MQLSVWTYEGPPHVGAIRVATGMKDVHLVLHAPQGDTYADLLFTMIERRDHRPPVTYTTFEARDLGRDTAEIFKETTRAAYERHQPSAILVGASCTAELLQDDPAGLAKASGLPVPVIPLELPSYSRREHWGASETLYQLVRQLADRNLSPSPPANGRPTCNILGPTALGFRHRDDVREICQLLDDNGVEVSSVLPLGSSVDDIRRVGTAKFNVVLYPEVGDTTARWLERTFGQPFTKCTPYGIDGTRRFLDEVSAITGTSGSVGKSNFPWWSRSVDSTYLTGKRVFIFGEGQRVADAARVADQEFGFDVAGLGCYNREAARNVRAAAADRGVDALITDDYLDVEAAIAETQPELVLGTQMERHIAKRLSIPCAVISGPAHVHDFPARFSPQMGPEGANVLFDTWTHPLVMGLEEHLLGMFRDDFEFHDGAGPSHLGHGHTPPTSATDIDPSLDREAGCDWTDDAKAELRKIPFFVRGKARRNTEAFAAANACHLITVETLYEAKAHYGR